MGYGKTIPVVVLVVATWTLEAAALGPRQVLVVANAHNRDSVALAKFYMAKRGIPKDNLVLLKTTSDFDIDRAGYVAQIRDPLRQSMLQSGLAKRIRCICVMFGVPGRITGQAPPGQPAARDDTLAAVDSELACLWWDDYELPGMTPNPLNWRMAATMRNKQAPLTLMVSRIDGPCRSDARRIIKASIAAEAKALRGTFYIDAGGLPRARAYDEHLRKLSAFVSAKAKLKVVFDDKQSTFGLNACPNAALYVGWYSLGRYVDSFTWAQGAVGWHISSFEAADLRNADSTKWCTKMIQNGVAATIGAVDEPYLAAFPRPKEFFARLLSGKLTLAECYWQTVPAVSWRMILIADPLYNPFVANPHLDLEDATAE